MTKIEDCSKDREGETDLERCEMQTQHTEREREKEYKGQIERPE